MSEEFFKSLREYRALVEKRMQQDAEIIALLKENYVTLYEAFTELVNKYDDVKRAYDNLRAREKGQ